MDTTAGNKQGYVKAPDSNSGDLGRNRNDGYRKQYQNQNSSFRGERKPWNPSEHQSQPQNQQKKNVPEATDMNESSGNNVHASTTGNGQQRRFDPEYEKKKQEFLRIQREKEIQESRKKNLEVRQNEERTIKAETFQKEPENIQSEEQPPINENEKRDNRIVAEPEAKSQIPVRALGKHEEAEFDYEKYANRGNTDPQSKEDSTGLVSSEQSIPTTAVPPFAMSNFVSEKAALRQIKEIKTIYRQLENAETIAKEVNLWLKQGYYIADAKIVPANCEFQKHMAWFLLAKS